MRKLENFAELNNERVWFYLEDDMTKENFCKEINELMDSSCKPLTVEQCNPIMSFGKGAHWAYVSIMIWMRSFDSNTIYLNRDYPPVRVDYKKYRNGDDDYMIE